MRKTFFTLIELMLVITIIGILTTILLPQLHQARESVKSAVCKSNTAEISKAAQLLYKNNNYFPLRRWGWAIDLDLILTGEDIKDLQSPVFICPKDERDNLGVGWGKRQSYAQNGTLSDSNSKLKAIFQMESPDKTIQFGDSDTDDRMDQSVRQVSIHKYPVMKHFNNLGRNFSFIDGHVEYVSWSTLLSRDTAPWFYHPDDPLGRW